MEKIKKVKIQNILDSQIPDFIENESPLFKEFLSQYYISQENQTGIVDLAINLSNYKSIDNFNPQSFYIENNPCILSEDISSFSSTIKVNHTIGFPEKYGLIKIDDEIITYTGITTNTFTGCIRGFSGLSKENNNDVFVFSSTDSVPHTQNSSVLNLNFQFFQEFFKKFKTEFLPGFEDRDFVDTLNYKQFLIKAKDFYASKGTDISFEILFKVLYGSEVSIVNPQDYLFTPSVNNYVKTKNILVERAQGNENLLLLKGKALYQKDSTGRIASATIYNVEYRPDQGKEFFEISLDPESFVYDFVATKKTSIIENVLEQNNILYVDSTSGFPDSGSLIIYSYSLSTPIIVTYSDKTLNQFNLDNPIGYELYFGDYVIENNLSYSYLDDGTKVEFRICNNISSIDVSKTFGLRVNDRIILSSIGKNLNDDPIAKNWNYNIPSKISNYKKVSSSTFHGELNTIPSEIQNVYFDEDNRSYYISASGFPKYEFAVDNATFSIVGTGTSIFNTTKNHNLLTGERIYIVGSSNSGIQTGFYYVTKLTNNTIQLSFSNFDAEEKKYIESSADQENVVFKYGYQNESTNSLKSLLNQNIFKRISTIKNKSSQNSIEKRTTNNKKIGILRNGVEICSPSFFNDSIYFGKVESIDVVSKGSDYDIINPPQLEIKDGPNTSAKCHANLVGSLKRIDVLSPGIGYQIVPKISLVGGNGSGAVIDPILKKEQLVSTFNADFTGISLNPTNTITFLSKHGFANGEGVIYDSNGNIEISSLVNDSTYYVHTINTTQVTIHENKDDALVGINTVNINSYGYGFHIFKSQDYKNIIDSVLVLNGGEGYSNKFVKIYSPIDSEFIYDNTGYTGISTFDNYIFAKNHNFKDLDILNYSSSGSPITGLSTTTQYYVTVIDSDRFTLSEVDNSPDPKKNYYYKKYVNITGVGTGEHLFSYPPISLNIESLSGTASTTIIEPTLNPVVLGEVENVYLSDPGNNYGSNGVINFNKSPLINFVLPTQSSILKPKVLNGSINNVEILNPGNGYSKDIDLIVVGNGKFAELYPIIENGRIIQIKILNSGKGYDNKTEIIIKKRGSGAKFYGNITEWTINQVKKNEFTIASISDGEGLLIPGDNLNFGLQYINFYPPSIFRDDLNDNGSLHSPILGWAYDGNPIYGPYGYSNINGSGLVQKMLNGYKEKDTKTLSDNKIRPSGFPQGFFIQDYEYEYDPNNNLDEYNGRYCVTPEFPNGVYAYFYSIDESLNPKFPYVVGNLFKNSIDDYNYNTLINQKTVDLNSLNLTRNIGNYDFDNYDIFTKLTQKNKENYIVNSTKSSGIGSIVIDYPGDNYKINDQIIFDNTNTDGFGINAFISRVNGKQINNFTIGVGTFHDISFVNINNKIIGIASTYHSINNYDSIKISNVSSPEYSYLEGSKVVNVFNCQTNLQKSLENQSITGVSTYIVVNQTQGFNVDDYIKIENEVLKVTNISSENSILFVNRFDSFTGIHSIGSVVKLLPKKFTIKDEDGFKLDAIENIKTYFNPSEVIGFGTVGTVHEKIIAINTDFGQIEYSQKNTIGINTTLIKLGDIITGQYVSTGTTVTSIGINSIGIGISHTFVSLGSTTNLYKISRNVYDKFIPEKSIHIPNHKFYTGQPLTYNSGLNGSGLIVSNVGSGSTFSINNDQVVYAVNLGVDFIGISTIGFSSSIGIGSTSNSLYFSDLNLNNTGKSHYFETKYPIVSATSEKYFINVSTTNTHGLANGDNIRFNYTPSFNEIISLRYDPIIRKITTELIEFNSSTGVNTITSEILLENNNFSTGDKIVYYNNGNNSIGGLVNNKEYYVIKHNSNKIKLSNYYSSSLVGDYIILSSVGVGTHSFALINPPINVAKGNVLSFNLENTIQMDLRLYEDLEFTKELERSIYFESNGVYKLKTNLLLNREIYYNFVPHGNSPLQYKQISSDGEVFGRNKITIEENTFSKKDFKISSGSENTFSINLNYKPEILSINDVNAISYDTDSKFASGPISKIKVNFQGRGYKKIPKIKEIISRNGNGAILNSVSTEIGKIDVLENVKNIYDFPTDNTLTPFLSIPTVCKIKDICRIDNIGIISTGRGYNTSPKLKVVGRDDIVLSAQIKNNSISSVTVSKNANNLSVPLEIVTLKNSNGYDIDNIIVGYANTTVTLELINNPQSYPLISTGYGATDIVFPFNVGDKIFIENCRVRPSSGDNYNSENYNYKFFTVVGVDTSNFTVTYSTDNISNNFGTYYTDFGYGYVCNYKDIAKFEMNLIDDLSYKSGEVVKSNNFTAIVMENGWDNTINELRLIDCVGSLTIGNKLYGTESGLNGKIIESSSFLLKSTMNPYKNKIVKNSLDKGMLNEYSIRISDNNYYQKFSYAINGEVPYLTWKNAVKSLIHPSGFKEFSDLNIISKASTKLRPTTTTSSIDLVVDIDSLKSFNTKDNFCLVTESNQYEDGSIQNIVIGSENANVIGIGETFVGGIPLKSYILNKSNKVIKLDDISDQFTGITSSIGGNVVGLTSFKLRSNNSPVFHLTFDSSSSNTINIENNIFNINNHNLQTGQKLYYNSYSGQKIGIKTTSLCESSVIIKNDYGYLSVASTSESNIITSIGSGIGSAIYENGYNNNISGVVGVGTTAPIGTLLRFFGTAYPYIPSSTSGLGTGAKFSVIFEYDYTGSPLSTSVILRDGGSNYNIGDNVSIAGTFLKGTTPENDLSFTVSTLSSTSVIGAANSTFNNISGITITGNGSGALFNISRDSVGSIKSTEIVDGGVGYALTDKIKILGTDIGGASPADDYLISPTDLGTNKLPSIVYVNKLNDNKISLSGLSTQLSNSQFDLIGLGTGNQSFTVDNPNANSLIAIDNVIQSPIYLRNISISLANSVGIGSTVIYLNSGISSITTLDTIKLENEYLKINSVGGIGTNTLEVERGFFGSIATSHTINSPISLVGGDYNIVNDVIHFSKAPYGFGSLVNSSFQGRVFSRSYDQLNAPNDTNIILDDISSDFTGISATSFTLKSNNNNVVGLFTDTNGGVDINNNPIILINNIPQISGKDYTIDTAQNNKINFIGGTPKAGKIVRIGLTTGFGYQPLVGASASVSVSSVGTISNVYVKGSGSGYRIPPQVSISSTQGSGAIITSSVGAGGTISLFITNPGSGYTTSSLPTIKIAEPPAYSNLPIVYSTGYSGLGTNAKASVVVGNGSSIINFNLDEVGTAYKVGDVLTVSGITTNPNAGLSFDEFKITVLEVMTDKFTGFYPGQLIQFEDISSYFNGKRRSFVLYYKNNLGKVDQISLKSISGSDLNLENNLIVYINDIIQEPGTSYVFNGSRVLFSEPPKANSKCTILFYRGSDLDVEQIDPPKTIKEGDFVQINENQTTPHDVSQLERIVKTINSPENFDTFVYDSVGIDTNSSNSRPLSWTKQTKDKIINGVLYSKSRPNLSSRIIPTTSLIKNVSKTDSEIYVMNAFPLFKKVDNIKESLSDVIICDNTDASPGVATAYVSFASTISSVIFSNNGSGYGKTMNPRLSIPSPTKLNDPIKNWTTSSGISTTYSFNSIKVGTSIVAIGNSNLLGLSTNGISWSQYYVPIGTNINYQALEVISDNNYIMVGSNGKIATAVGIGSTLSNWSEKAKLKIISQVGEVQYDNSDYNKTLNSVSYLPHNNTISIVGSSGTVFYAQGIGATSFIETKVTSYDLNSVTNNGVIFVMVGGNGYIGKSVDSKIWNQYQPLTTNSNLNKVIWSQNKFIIVGDNGYVAISTDSGNSWETKNTNILDNLKTINYYKNDLYTALNDNGELYYSFDLMNWEKRSTNQTNKINDLTYVDSLGIDGRYIGVGTSGTIIYSDPIKNRAEAYANSSFGSITSATITNGGFGYANDLQVLVEPETPKEEKLISIKAKGDYGVIVGINTFPKGTYGLGNTTAPKIEFVLKSDYYTGTAYSGLNKFKTEDGQFITYSQLQKGDYFTIFNGNSTCGHAVTGISTDLGGLSAYPDSKIGTAGTAPNNLYGIDGVYRAEYVISDAISGIVTVTCHLYPINYFSNIGYVDINVGAAYSNYYGNYSWGKIYDYQNRQRENPQSFTVDTDNGISGLSTAPEVYRTRGLV